MQIREAIAADARQIVRIFHDTIHAVNTRDYSAEQVQAWSPVVPDADAWAARKFPPRSTFVAEDQGTIVGFAELEASGHVDCFYCHHRHQRRGIGTALYLRIEDQARALGLARLFVEASITAKPFFEAQGFVAVKRQTVVRQGVALANFVMEKTLAASPTADDTRRSANGSPKLSA